MSIESITKEYESKLRKASDQYSKAIEEATNWYYSELEKYQEEIKNLITQG